MSHSVLYVSHRTKTQFGGAELLRPILAEYKNNAISNFDNALLQSQTRIGCPGAFIHCFC